MYIFWPNSLTKVIRKRCCCCCKDQRASNKIGHDGGRSLSATGVDNIFDDVDKEETPFDEANSWDTSSTGSHVAERRKRQAEEWELTEKKKNANDLYFLGTQPVTEEIHYSDEFSKRIESSRNSIVRASMDYERRMTMLNMHEK